jgi:HK97 family phage major capsid protein
MNSKEIRFKINQILTEQQKLALAGFTTESRSAFDKMQKEVESLEAALKIEERLAEGRNFDRSPRPIVASGDGNETRKVDVSKAFRNWARNGNVEAEYRDVLTINSGQAVIPQEFLGTCLNPSSSTDQ